MAAILIIDGNETIRILFSRMFKHFRERFNGSNAGQKKLMN